MERLNKIFSLVDKCTTFADIGCDHGKLSRLVADARLADRIVAADISAASLLKARELLKSYPSIEFYVSDGFNQIPTSVDLSVISGMGGREIIKIITDYCLKNENVNRIKTLILQPQNHIGAVRSYLCSNGYSIVADEIVKENNKFYFVIKATDGTEANSGTETDDGTGIKAAINPKAINTKANVGGIVEKSGEATVPTAVQESYGMFYTERSALLKELLEKDEKKYSSFKATKENLDKLEIIREALLCQR